MFLRFGGPNVAILDAATFVLGASAFALMRAPDLAPPATARNWRKDITEGTRYLWCHPVLRRLVVAGSATMFAAGLNGAAVYALVDAGLHRPPAFAGVLYAVQGTGSVLSGLTAGAFLRRIPERVFATSGIAAFALGVGMRALPSAPVALAGSAVLGAGLPCVLIAAMTAVQRETPSSLVGRVAATANTLIFVPNALTLLFGAALSRLSITAWFSSARPPWGWPPRRTASPPPRPSACPQGAADGAPGPRGDRDGPDMRACLIMNGFRKFILRGNLVDMAVAVVIGTQFSGLVKQFVDSFINPLLALIGGQPDFTSLVFKVGKARFTYGAFLTQVLSFLISAAVVYFVIVLPVARLLRFFERDQAATERDCPECTRSIPIAARRCPECTAQISPATEGAAKSGPVPSPQA